MRKPPIVTWSVVCKLDSKEATHCHFICCVYIKGINNTKDQRNMWKDVKEIERRINGCTCYSCYTCQKVESGVCDFYATLYTEKCYSCFSCWKGRKSIPYKVTSSLSKICWAHRIFTHNFLKNVLRSVDFPNQTTKSYVCQSMLKGSKVISTFNPFDMLQHI